MAMPTVAQTRGPHTISTDPKRLDVDAVHAYLSRSYWAKGIPRDVVATSLAASLCFGVYEGVAQIGFARVITDGATFAYLCDVYVLEEHQGKKLARWLMEMIMAHPELQGIRRFVLVTTSAPGMYHKFGFTPVPEKNGYMQVVRRHAYET